MLRRHLVATSLFAPFVVARLRAEEHPCEALLTVRCRGLTGGGEMLQTVRLLWSPESASAPPPAVQDNTVTE
jgi:hypothetical protein